MRVIVTGGTSGLGKAAAAALGADDHSVVPPCRSVSKGEQAAAEMEGDVRVCQVDLADLASVHKFADSVESVDVLVNNAGILGVASLAVLRRQTVLPNPGVLHEVIVDGHDLVVIL